MNVSRLGLGAAIVLSFRTRDGIYAHVRRVGVLAAAQVLGDRCQRHTEGRRNYMSGAANKLYAPLCWIVAAPVCVARRGFNDLGPCLPQLRHRALPSPYSALCKSALLGRSRLADDPPFPACSQPRFVARIAASDRHSMKTIHRCRAGE